MSIVKWELIHKTATTEFVKYSIKEGTIYRSGSDIGTEGISESMVFVPHEKHQWLKVNNMIIRISNINYIHKSKEDSEDHILTINHDNVNSTNSYDTYEKMNERYEEVLALVGVYNE